MRSPAVSFVVPCYNYARYLPDCLRSIFCQEGAGDFEVIAIDDASTDDTQEVLRRFRDPRLRVITHARNAGHVDTVNEGLGETRGRYVARIDPDDRYRPHFLCSTIEKLEAYPEVGLVYGDVSLINERGEETAGRCDIRHGGRDFKGNEFVALLESNFICAPSVIARRETWIRALPVPAGLAFNDWYFTLMIAREHEFYYVDRVVADYRVHSANHHANVVRNRTEEPSIFRLLDSVYARKEDCASLEREKRRARSRIYGAQYRALADKYFGMGMDHDARRCYLAAIRHQPFCIFRATLLKHLAATFMGRRSYESLKALVRG